MSTGSRTEIFLRRAAVNRPAIDEMEQPAVAENGSPEPSTPVILVLVDLTASDARVVDTAAALAGASRATIVLLHVAPPLPRRRRAWEAMLAVEAAARETLRRLAGRWLPRSHLVQISVRFGDTPEQAAKAATAVGASLVVAASRPAWWRWWRNRDRQLRRHLDVPVLFVAARGEEPVRRCGLTRPAPSSAGGTRAAA